MFLEVPLAGPGGRERDRGDGAPSCRRRSTRRLATRPARRRSTTPDKLFHQILARAAGNELLLRVHRLDPRGAPAAADRQHRLDARPRRGGPRASIATSSGRSAAASRPAPSARCALTSRTYRTFSAASSSGASSHSRICSTPPGPSVTGTPVATPSSPYSPSTQHRRDPRLAVAGRQCRDHPRRPGTRGPGRRSSGVERDVAPIPTCGRTPPRRHVPARIEPPPARRPPARG